MLHAAAVLPRAAAACAACAFARSDCSVRRSTRSASWSAAPRTVTTNIAVSEFPAASATVHVTVVVPIENAVPEAGAHANDSTPTLSAAEDGYVTTAPAGLVASTVRLEGTVIVGASTSSTVTCWPAVAALPARSVTVQVIVLVPTGYGASRAAPSERVPATTTPEQLSAAVAVPGSTAASPRPGSLPTVTAAGVVTDGSSASTTVTVCAATAVLPAASVAVQTIV